jgi:hypothetical protein
VTTNESFVNVTSTASVTGLAVVVLVPGSDELISMLLNHSAERRQLVATKTPRLRQLNRLQPKLRVFLRVLNVNVTRFMAFTTEKEKPKSTRP